MDPAIEGAWKSADAKVPLDTGFLAFRKRKTAYALEGRQAGTPEIIDASKLPNSYARTTSVENVKFIIIDAKPSMRGLAEMHPPSPDKAEEFEKIEGGIWRYEVSSQTLSLFALKDQRLESAIKSGELKGTPTGTLPALLSKLDSVTLTALAKMSLDNDAWEESRYIKVTDLNQAVDKARQYPATSSTQQAREIYVNIPAFELVYENPNNALRRQLQASPEWFVYQEGQTDIVADRRRELNGVWHNSSSGFHSESRNQERQRFRFTSRLVQQNPVKSQIDGFRDITTNASATEGTVSLAMRKTRQGIESYFTVGSPGLWFEIFEQTQVESRNITRDSIAWFAQFSESVSRGAAEIDQMGYLSAELPSGAIARGTASIEINDGLLTAHINLGEQGIVFIKVLDEATSAPLDASLYDWGAKEYIGWSSDPATLFLYQKDLTSLAWHLKDESKAVRVQLWFRPCNGEAGPIWFERETPADRFLLESRMLPPAKRELP